MDFTRKIYIHIGLFPLKQEIFLKYELFLDSAIKIRYRKVVPYGKEPKPMANGNQMKQEVKKKVKERTIREAEYYVTKWRNLY